MAELVAWIRRAAGIIAAMQVHSAHNMDALRRERLSAAGDFATPDINVLAAEGVSPTAEPIVATAPIVREVPYAGRRRQMCPACDEGI